MGVFLCVYLRECVPLYVCVLLSVCISVCLCLYVVSICDCECAFVSVSECVSYVARICELGGKSERRKVDNRWKSKVRGRALEISKIDHLLHFRTSFLCFSVSQHESDAYLRVSAFEDRRN